MNATVDMAAIETRGLTKTYDGKVEALRGVDLVVKRGEMFALLGPNGAGKTTLFSILATLRKPSGGEARVLGLDVLKERPAIRQRMGIVFQEPALEQRMSVRDNLLLMALFYGLSLTTARQRVVEIIETLQLKDIEGRQAQKLSGGQKRKLELARSLVSNPDILFLDEATLGLDVDARRNFWAQVRMFVRSGRSVFFTTHYMEEAEVADRIALIDAGRIIALGTPKELKNRIGGGVILLGTQDDSKALDWLTAQGYKPERNERGILVVHAEPAAVLPIILAEMPVKTLRAEVHEPSLEDVFLTLTGRGLSAGEAAKPPARFRHGRCPMRGLFAVIILDLKRLWVDRIRLVSSLIQPLLYLFLLGSGLGGSSHARQRPLYAVHLPGVVALSLLFTSVFAAILIVFDRQMGFLKAVLVAPVPRPAIAIGKVIAGAIQALVPATIMMIFMPLIGLIRADGIL